VLPAQNPSFVTIECKKQYYSVILSITAVTCNLGDDLIPPNAGGDVGIRCNEVTRRARPIGRTAKMRLNDLLGIMPRFLVLDGFDAKV
jgi:hypothetical protein